MTTCERVAKDYRREESGESAESRDSNEVICDIFADHEKSREQLAVGIASIRDSVAMSACASQKAYEYIQVKSAKKQLKKHRRSYSHEE